MATDERVIVFFTTQDVVTFASDQCVIAATGPNGVIASTAIDYVHANARLVVVKYVVAVTKFYIRSRSCTEDIIIFGCSDYVLNIGIRVASCITANSACFLVSQWSTAVDFVKLERYALS